MTLHGDEELENMLILKCLTLIVLSYDTEINIASYTNVWASYPLFLRPDGDLTGPLHHDRQEGVDLRRHGGSHLLAGWHRLYQPQEDERRQECHDRRGQNHVGRPGNVARALSMAYSVCLVCTSYCLFFKGGLYVRASWHFVLALHPSKCTSFWRI